MVIVEPPVVETDEVSIEVVPVVGGAVAVSVVEGTVTVLEVSTEADEVGEKIGVEEEEVSGGGILTVVAVVTAEVVSTVVTVLWEITTIEEVAGGGKAEVAQSVTVTVTVLTAEFVSIVGAL